MTKEKKTNIYVMKFESEELALQSSIKKAEIYSYHVGVTTLLASIVFAVIATLGIPTWCYWLMAMLFVFFGILFFIMQKKYQSFSTEIKERVGRRTFEYEIKRVTSATEHTLTIINSLMYDFTDLVSKKSSKQIMFQRLAEYMLADCKNRFNKDTFSIAIYEFVDNNFWLPAYSTEKSKANVLGMNAPKLVGLNLNDTKVEDERYLGYFFLRCFGDKKNLFHYLPNKKKILNSFYWTNKARSKKEKKLRETLFTIINMPTLLPKSKQYPTAM